MTKERAAALAAALDVGLDSPGVCPACLLFVASEAVAARSTIFRAVVRRLAAAISEEVVPSRITSMN